RDVEPGRDQPPVDAEALVGEPVDDVGGREDLALRLANRLALLEGHDMGDPVGPLAHQPGRGPHDRGPLCGGLVPPVAEAAVSRLQRPVQVGDRGVGDRADDPAVRRVADVERPAVRGLTPLPVDEQTGIRVGGAAVGAGGVIGGGGSDVGHAPFLPPLARLVRPRPPIGAQANGADAASSAATSSSSRSRSTAASSAGSCSGVRAEAMGAVTPLASNQARATVAGATPRASATRTTTSTTASPSVVT